MYQQIFTERVVNSKERKATILKKLDEATAPISAVSLATEFGVSRQVIVGDVSILRAEGRDIIATSRGYMIGTPTTGKFIRKIACKHGREGTEKELSAIVTLGGEIIDVIVTHPLYGDLTGQLNIRTMEDVMSFVEQTNKSETLLSDLTDGVHLHTIAFKDKASFDKIMSVLERLEVIIKN